MNEQEIYKGFLPEVTIEGKIGFYPAMTHEEYRALPLPMKCATWDASVQSVIFDTFFEDYGISGKVEISAEKAFKALFRCSRSDTQLYTVCGVQLTDGRRVGAKWYQDSISGAFEIVALSGKVLGAQGGFRGHIPANCGRNAAGEWVLYPKIRAEGKIIRASF